MDDIVELNEEACPRVASSESGTTATVPLHRHCQATVLSVNGTGTKNGATWTVFENLSLPNLPSNWKNEFTGNKNNITQDLAAILRLINTAAGAIGGNIKIIFQDISGTALTGQTFIFNPSSSETNQHTFQIGRKIQLNMDGTEVVSFHTAMTQPSDNCDIPTKTLKIVKKYSDGGELKVATTASSDVTIDVSEDFPHLPINGANNSKPIKIGPEAHSYRLKIGTERYELKFDFGNYVVSGSPKYKGTNIQFEVHIQNARSGPVTLTSPSDNKLVIDNLPNDTGYSRMEDLWLTDLRTIPAGEKAVYVFRYDQMWRDGTISDGMKSRLIISLAYKG